MYLKAIAGREPIPTRLAVVAMLLAATLPYAETSYAATAKLFINPTLVELNNRQRSATVSIVNRGDATGIFTIEWVDYVMTEEGGLAVAESDSRWSLQPHIRYSPRRATLRPGETQLVKIALRHREGVAEGEYYSHLRVLTLNDNVSAEAGAARPSVTVEARSAIAVPVVWRNSREKPRAMISSVQFDAERHELSIDVQRIGSLSTRGYLHVRQTAVDGERQALASPTPLVIYPSVEHRRMAVALTTDSLDLEPGSQLEIVYSTAMDANEATPDLASYRLVL